MHLFDFPQFSAGLRIGNLLVPNDNYCKFEDWLMPILDQMVLEQNTEVGVYIWLLLTQRSKKTLGPLMVFIRQCAFLQGIRWTPSKMIHRLGKEINNPDSVYYWAYKVSDLKYSTHSWQVYIVFWLFCLFIFVHFVVSCIRITFQSSVLLSLMALWETWSTSTLLRTPAWFWT